MINEEIKRLLKLKTIPGFKLLPQEEAKLEEWKNAQAPVKVRRSRGRRKKTEPTTLADLKVTNEVKAEEKEYSDSTEQ